MKAKLMLPIEFLRGKFAGNTSDYYARMLNGKQIIQRCPTRNKPPTIAQLQARKRFVERYAATKHET